MEPLGKYLKRERELRNISLSEVAKKTRIRENLLRDIEEDRYHLLPSSTYVKGFLLAYAKYIGLDTNDVLLRYEVVLKGESIPSAELPSERKGLENKKHLWIIGGMILAILFLSYLLYPSKAPIEFISSKPDVEKKTFSPSSPQPKGPVSAPEEKPISLRCKAVEETWVRVQVDGQLKQEAILKPGDELFFQALKQIQFSTGNAGGLDLIWNGKPLERVGRSGEVVTLIFMPQDVKTIRHEKTKTP
jgi:cytoskeletal protein RodZ